MKCPSCDSGKLSVMRVYAAGNNAETRDLSCPECGYKASSITFLVERPQGRKRGRGSMALKRQIERGEVANPVDEP